MATKENLFSVRAELKDDIASVKVALADTKVDLGRDINRTYRSLLFWIVITSFLSGILASLPEIIALFSR